MKSYNAFLAMKCITHTVQKSEYRWLCGCRILTHKPHVLYLLVSVLICTCIISMRPRLCSICLLYAFLASSSKVTGQDVGQTGHARVCHSFKLFHFLPHLGEFLVTLLLLPTKSRQMESSQDCLIAILTEEMHKKRSDESQGLEKGRLRPQWLWGMMVWCVL